MSASSDSNKMEDASDSPDDPWVEIPCITGKYELIKKSQVSSMDIRGMVVRCTSCLLQINHHDVDKCMKHYRLNVIVCKECHDFYGQSDFSQDESGNYNYCTWCGNGGKLYLCDFCPNSFCSTCVRRNFGRAEVSKMSKEGWKCYICNPEKLKSKLEFCNLILDYSQNSKKRKEKKTPTESLMNKISGPLSWTETKDWVLPAFDELDDSCKTFHKRLDKLKVIGSSQSKSLRHVIKKMEQIIISHKNELGLIIKTLSGRYVKYLEQRNEAEKRKNEKGGDSKGNTEAKVNGTTEKEPMISIDITSDNENDVSKADDISDNNYKAKMSLLEEESSGSSFSETETSKATAESKDADNSSISECKEKTEEKVSEISKKTTGEKSESEDVDNSSIAETEEKVTENGEEDTGEISEKEETKNVNEDSSEKEETKNVNEDSSEKEETKNVNEDSSEKEEAMETDDIDVQSRDLFENRISDVEGANAPTENSPKSTKEKTKTNTEDAKPVISSKPIKAKAPKSTNRKLSFLDTEPVAGDSSSSISDSDKEDTKRKKTRQKTTPKKDRKAIRKVKETKPVDCDDSKLKLDIQIVVQKCDNLLPNGETTIPLPEEYLLEEIDKEIEALRKSPPKLRKAPPEKEKKSKTSGMKKKVSESKKPIKISDSSSSSICFSSSEDENKETEKSRFSKTKGKEDPNLLAKKELLISDSDASSESSADSGSDEVKKKKSQKKGKAKSDSSDDFQPKKKKKYDKLLSKRIISDDDSSKDNDKEKKPTEKKKSTKRKHVASEDEFNSDKKDSDSGHTSTSDSEEEKDKKKKKRKRIKKAAVSSSENEDGNDKDKKESQGTPGKGRKNIKKIITKKDLAVETKEAQNAERERRKRVTDRQKMYNIITDTPTDGSNDVVTRKMVLEVDQTSKEEIVEIHPELCEKLKPHQVKGVRFMWECTIESLKELEKGTGSGCILAHCMGLGKTLQVITFLHTCLTNEHVNKKIRTALVICPYNTILNWAREFEYWLEKIEGDVLVHQLTDGKDNYTRLDILKYWQRDGGVLIASYDIFRRLAADKKIAKLTKKNREKLYELLVNPGPDIVVCDEGHILKNENSAVSKACSQLATERRIVLTGTPLQNNLKEYHCMLSFVKPHLLGTSKEFRNRFVNPIMNGQYEDSNEYDVRRMKKRIHILHKLLEGCVQRCDYSALTKFLPPKHEFVISVKLSEVQIKMYQHYLDNLSRHKSEAKIRGGTLFSDYNILRNLCTHPYIVHTSSERAEERRMANGFSSEDEEFINDASDESTPKSASGSGSGSESHDEVVKTYKTRSRKAENGSEEEIEPEEAIKEKRWYHEFISDEDRHRLELSGKMVLLIDILKECEAIGDKVILFSQSLLTLDIIEDILSNIDEQEVSEEDKKRDVFCKWTKGVDYFRMDGTTSADFRKRYIDMFNSPQNDRARLFLVSTKAGGLGTNLIGANRVVMLDASWNPSHDVQAIFRVYRFGQKKPVYIYRLLAQGTMEEKIYDRQVTKLSLSIRVVDEQQIDRHFNAAELAELYNFTPDSVGNRPTPLVPKDTLLAEMLIKHNEWIVTYHEHDSLLQNQTEEDLTEEDRKAAWNEYENEREGRSIDEVNMDEEISEYSKEPDFSQADYVGSMIPTCKSMIEGIIANLKKKFPNFSAIDLRKKLLMSLYTLRSIFQEKHVRILRMKQEYVAKGSVPSTINKYLQELNLVLNELAKHSDNIQKMVQADHTAQIQAQLADQQARFQQQQQQQQARFQQPQQQPNVQSRPVHMPTQMPFAGVRIPRGANFPPFVRMHQNLQARMAQFPGGINPGLSNYRSAGDQRWNTAGNINAGRRFTQIPTPKTYTETLAPQQPVITEVDKEESNSLPEYSNNATSSVVIEEID